MSTLTLPASCDRAAARELLPVLRAALGSEPLIIDACGVERIGQAMLQLLVSAARSEGGIAIRNPSDTLLDTLRMTGLDKVLVEEIADAKRESEAA